jgi:hypothetical protein
MRRLIGTAITTACRLALRAGLGLRLPAAHIRQHDLIKNREYAAAKVREAMDDTAYWMDELHRLDDAIDAAGADLAQMHQQRKGLSVPSPTSPLGDL